MAERGGYGAKGMPWASCYLELESAVVVEEGGYQNFRAAVPRLDVVPGEVEGRGWGEIALNTALSLNTLERLGLEDLALKARPAVLTRHDSVVGTLSLRPATPIVVRVPPGMDIRNSIAPFETGSRPEVSMLSSERMEAVINKCFYVDQILKMLEVDKAEMTAYEFAQKMQLLFRLLGPVYGRMQSEFLKPFWDSHFLMLYMAGMLPPPPPIVLEYEDGGDIGVDFENPLARAQKTGAVQSMNLALADLAPLIEMEMKIKGYSETLDYIDQDKWAKKIFDVHGVPATVVKSDKEVKQSRDARTQAQQAERQNQEMMMGTEAIKNVAPMLKAVQGGKAA